MESAGDKECFWKYQTHIKEKGKVTQQKRQYRKGNEVVIEKKNQL